MKSKQWSAIELLSKQQRFEYQQLKDLIARFELTLDYKQWRKSQWLQKGSSYALLRKAYQLLDTIECRYRMYALSFLYDPKLQKYVEHDRMYLKSQQIDEVMYLLKVLTSHYDPGHQPPQQTRTSESFNLGFISQPSRFSRFMDQLSLLLKDKCEVVLSQRELRDFAKMQWKKLIQQCGFNCRQDRTNEIARELMLSLRYQRVKLQMIRELYEIQKPKNQQISGDLRGAFLKEIIQKKQISELQQAFSRFNNQLYEKERCRQQFSSFEKR